MKKTLLIIFLLNLLVAGMPAHADGTQPCPADGFAPTIKRLYNGCVMLAAGVANGDCEMVGMAVDSLNQNIDFEPKPVVIGKLRVTTVDVSGVVAIGDNFDFTDTYGLKWRDEHCNLPIVSAPGQMRGSADCYALALRLEPGATARYTTNMRRHCQVFAIAEPGSTLDCRLSAPGDNPVDMQRVDSNLWAADWDAGPRLEKYTIELTNNSDFASTIYFVTN